MHSIIEGSRIFMSNVAGRKVIEKAKLEIGVVESPAYSNHGTKVEEWQTLFGIQGYTQSGTPPEPGTIGPAWSACFATSMYVNARVDDEDIGDPAVLTMWKRAKSLDRISLIPAVGCFTLFGEFNSSGVMTVGHHVGLFVRWHNYARRQMVIIDGNHRLPDDSNDGVQIRICNYYKPIPTNAAVKTSFGVPKAIARLDKISAH